MAKSFRDLVVVQRALDLVVTIYDVTAAFPRFELYGLTSQLRRAAVGVLSHLGEGQGRLTWGERRQFLSQSRGSLFEVDAQCVAANRLRFLSDADHDRVLRDLRRTAAALAGYIKWVKAQETATKKPRNPATR
jgi:four helix bundle protein